MIGQDLTSALQDGKCTQVLRASYLSATARSWAPSASINLSTTNEAHHAGKVVGKNDFIAPLSTTKGVASKLGKGTGDRRGGVQGPLPDPDLVRVRRRDAPANDDAGQTSSKQFSNDLVAGTANINLSQRMVTGAATPATAAS